MAVTTMMTYLTQYNSDPYWDTDPLWRQCVLDHLDLIKANGNTYTISNDDLVQCTYNPIEYFRRLKIRESLMWITMLLNGWTSATDFNLDMPSRVCALPSETYIEQLYDYYKTSKVVSN